MYCRRCTVSSKRHFLLTAALIATVGSLAAPAQGRNPTHENVKYGPHERNVLDFWQAESKRPTPVIVYFHGGGFKNGDKSSIRRSRVIDKCLQSGVSFAAVNYPFLADDRSYVDIMRHCARSIQALRARSKEWNIDGRRIGAFGGSAGALISEWIGYHGDLGNRNSKDPVARFSSTLQVVGGMNQPIGSQLVMVHMRRGGPPLFLYTSAGNNDNVHHPKNAKMVKGVCDSVGIPAVMYIKGENPPPGGDAHGALLEFFFKHLGVEPKELKK